MVNNKNTIKKPVWLKYSEEEINEIVLKLVEKNPEFTSEKIGLILRDQYGIPNTKIYGLKIGKVLKKAGKYVNPDKKNLVFKVQKLEKHLEKNIHDQKTKRALIITKAKLKKVNDYLTAKQQ